MDADTAIWAMAAVIVVVAIVAIGWAIVRRRQRRRLEERFGPEWERAIDLRGDRGEAAAELHGRVARRNELDIRPLSPAMRDHFADEWQHVQSFFVEEPSVAVGQADALVAAVMRERGYPVDDFEERSDLVSVDHPVLADRYRRAHAVHVSNRSGAATVDDLREALLHYRALFAELLDQDQARTTR